ncbi:MAG: SET domain-containing protein [Ekhidna sp.]|uniref:SET domain-containing protein n=1 Tax=Ekhidna sp. TaxID=2608089 RepID=UPI0032EDC8FB
MIHPKTEIKHISDEVGYGVFATAFIPEGTIVYVKDSLEITVTPTDYLLYSKEMQDVIEKYSYIDEQGNRIISWDFAKYVNHCCNCNTISTGYGFEMAIRDIFPGEQITDEYGIFNLEVEIPLICGEKSCRKKVSPADFDSHYEEWDGKIKKSISKLFDVDQPLIPLIDTETRAQLDQLFKDPAAYKSVYSLRNKNSLKSHLPQSMNGRSDVAENLDLT